jgi:hypothetical protein
MSQQTRAQLQALRGSLIKSGNRQTTAVGVNTVLDAVIVSLMNILDDANNDGGFLQINSGRVDISKINAASPQQYFLRDDGTWQPAESGGKYNVLDCGLIGDGIFDNTAALNTLLNTTAPSGSTIVFPPSLNFLIRSNIAINGKQFNFIGNFSTISTASNVQIFNISNASKWRFSNLIFSGNSSGSNQYAFYFSAASGSFAFYNCTFTNFAGGGVAINNTESSTYLGGLFSSCKFYGNNIAADLSFTRPEYIQFIGCDIFDNTGGIICAGGNLIVNGCNITYNGTGIELLAGTNNGHGIISNNNINHNTTYNLYIHNTVLGMTISNNHFYQGEIKIANTTGVNISGGIIDVNAYTLTTNVGLLFSGVSFDTSYSNVVTLIGTAPQFNSCYNIDGTSAACPSSGNAITFDAETVVSSAASLTMKSPTRYFIFTGSASTWTLFALTEGLLNRPINIKNRGSGNITLNTFSGGNDIYKTSALNTLTIGPGSSMTLIYDGTFFNAP